VQQYKTFNGDQARQKGKDISQFLLQGIQSVLRILYWDKAQLKGNSAAEFHAVILGKKDVTFYQIPIKVVCYEKRTIQFKFEIKKTSHSKNKYQTTLFQCLL
jgi:hypothetical protein